MSKKKILAILAVILTVVLSVTMITVAAVNQKATLNISVVTKDGESNDLVKTLNSNYSGITVYSSLDQALAAVTEETEGIMVLADNYPNATTVLTDAQTAKINELGVRVYIEYPAVNEALGIVGYGETAKMRYDRAIVTDSEAMGMELYSLLYVHGAQYVQKTDISDSWLVNATVVGYDTVEFYDETTGELTDCTPYSMLEVNDAGNVLIASTKLSQFISARYAPYSRWQSLWMSVISWVSNTEKDALNTVEWTAAVNPHYGPDELLEDDAYSEAVRLNMEWFMSSGLLKNADGSEGVLEGFQSGNHFNVYGDQTIRNCLRADCNGETIGAMALAAELLGNDEYKTVAYNLMDWLLNESVLANDVRSDPESAQYGLLSWHDGALDQYYGDDNARAILGLIIGAAALETDEFDERILEAILANFRTTGVNGFRGSILTGENLESNGWKYFYNRTGTVNYRSHFESLLWATYLWAYEQTGYEPLLERTKTAISMMMTAYDNTMAGDADNNDEWFWTNGLQQERAKMILPLAWLVRIEPTAEHIGWLDKIITDMMAYQDEDTGALREVKGEGGVGAPVYSQFEKNSDYGQHESPVIQNNGDPCTDALYTSSFAMMTLNESYAVMLELGNTELANKYKQYNDALSDYFVRIQQISDSKPEYNGLWFRGFDYEKWETYGSDGDAGWGIWCAETGWCQAWISTALTMQEMNTNIWDYTKSSTVDEHFLSTAKVMLEYEPDKPTVSSNKSMRFSVDLTVDGNYGSTTYSDGKWTGFQGGDFIITVDYKYIRTFDAVKVGVIHDMSMGISSPASIVIYGSEDGESYTQIGSYNLGRNPQSDYDNFDTVGKLIDRVEISVPKNTTAKFIKVEYKNAGTFVHSIHGTCTTWVFTDEIELVTDEITMQSIKALINEVEGMNLSIYRPDTVLVLQKAYDAAVEYYNSDAPAAAKLEKTYNTLYEAIEGLVESDDYSVVSYNIFSHKWRDLSQLTDGVIDKAVLGGKVLTNLSTLEEQTLELFVDMGSSIPIYAIGYAADSTSGYGKYLQNAEFFVSDSLSGPWVSVGTVEGRKHNGEVGVTEYRAIGAEANGGAGRYVKAVFSRNADNEVIINGRVNRSEWLYLTEIFINEYVPINAGAEDATVSIKYSNGKPLSIIGAIVGENLDVTVTPREQYYISALTLNEESVAHTEGRFTISEVRSMQTVFARALKYTAADIPTIRVKDWFITPGQALDLLTDIYACDKNGKDITSSVRVVSGNVGNTVGTYPITYRVVDERGIPAEATANVYVVSNLSGKHVVAITPSTKDNLLNMAPQLVDGIFAPDGSGHGAAQYVSWLDTDYIEIVIALGGNIGIAELGYSLASCPTYGFLPPDVDFYVADVIGQWTKVGTFEAVLHPYTDMAKYDYIKRFLALDDVKASYVKAVIRFDDNPEMLANYKSTPSKGIPAWTFTDEIMINPYYSVSAGNTENGSVNISTNNASGALYGESATITFTPEKGYALAGVTVGGVSVKVNGNTYILTNITKHQVINATFEKECIKSAAVKLGDSIALIYYAFLDGATDAQMRFTMNQNSSTVEGELTETNNLYAFTFTSIAPQCMGDNVRAELIVDGTVVDVIEEFSIKAYASSMLKKIQDKSIAGYTDTQYAALGTLIADMLEYGATAQIYVDYKTEDGLVNEGIEGKTEFTDLSDDCEAIIGESTSDDSYFVSAGIRFDYLNSMYFKFAAVSSDGIEIKITNNSTGEARTYSKADFTLVKEGVYIMYSNPIAPYSFDTRYTVELFENDVLVQTVDYGITAYVYYIQSQTTAMADLARALYNYGVSASKYKELT